MKLVLLNIFFHYLLSHRTKKIIYIIIHFSVIQSNKLLKNTMNDMMFSKYVLHSLLKIIVQTETTSFDKQQNSQHI